MKKTIKGRNEHAAALFMRAGNAGVAIAVDTRPQSIPNRRKKNDRKSVKLSLRKLSVD
ncbi:hypothetical protein ACOI1H_14585 [Loktanella sp. DJP18]|uniref:hypothetical protein n=1 Tax=Loktanella sp. DJP18 TaxID=3409788 RepID=UPI003BB7A13B